MKDPFNVKTKRKVLLDFSSKSHGYLPPIEKEDNVEYDSVSVFITSETDGRKVEKARVEIHFLQLFLPREYISLSRGRSNVVK